MFVLIMGQRSRLPEETPLRPRARFQQVCWKYISSSAGMTSLTRTTRPLQCELTPCRIACWSRCCHLSNKPLHLWAAHPCWTSNQHNSDVIFRLLKTILFHAKLGVYNRTFVRPPSCRLRLSPCVQVENFSRIYAANPTGESFKPKPTVIGVIMSSKWQRACCVWLCGLQMVVARFLQNMQENRRKGIHFLVELIWDSYYSIYSH